MRLQHWRVLVPTALTLAALPVTHAAFSLDIQPWSTIHEDAGDIFKRGTIIETLTQKQILYAANISVGTPPQSQLVQLAVNSADTLILASNSTYCRAVYAANCTAVGSYTANTSSTYEYLDSDFTTSYTNGLSASGDYITETLTIGNGTLTGQQLAVAYDTNRAYGLLGLGFAAQEAQALRTGRQYSNVPEAMADAGFINSNAYSLWLNSYEAGSGSILFGGIDTDKFEGDLMTVPLLTRSANSSDLLLPLSGVSLNSTKLMSGADVTASLDAGSTFMYLPDNVAQHIFNLTGAQHVDGAGVAEIDCDQKGNDTMLEFTISDWVNLNISISNLVFRFNASTCLFGITTINDSVQDRGTKLDAILGLTFLINAYVVYDLSNQEISLAPAKFNVTTSNIVEIQNGVNGVPGAIRTSGASSSGAATNTASSSNSTGLSAGASAGIGVGAAAVAILIALGAFFLWRRKRKSRKAMQGAAEERIAEAPAEAKHEDDKPPSDAQYGAMEAEGNELVEAPDHLAGQHILVETDGRGRVEAPGEVPAELEGGTPIELEGSGPLKEKK